MAVPEQHHLLLQRPPGLQHALHPPGADFLKLLHVGPAELLGGFPHFALGGAAAAQVHQRLRQFAHF